MALKISLLVGTFKAFHSLSNEHCDPVFSDATNWPSGKLYWSWHHSSFRVRHFPNYDWHDLILAFPCCCYLNFLLWVYMLSFYSLSLLLTGSSIIYGNWMYSFSSGRPKLCFVIQIIGHLKKFHDVLVMCDSFVT